jgi:CRISPR/Cas system-associated endonuclease Cas1
MEFTLDTCATAGFKNGKLTKSQNITLNKQTVSRNISLTRPVSTEEGEGAENNQMQGRLAKKYYQWVWQILTTELTPKTRPQLSIP